MKALFEIDLPDSCVACHLRYVNESGYGFCIWNDEHHWFNVPDSEYGNGRHEKCPLKILDTPKDIVDDLYMQVHKNIKAEFNKMKGEKFK